MNGATHTNNRRAKRHGFRLGDYWMSCYPKFRVSLYSAEPPHEYQIEGGWVSYGLQSIVSRKASTISSGVSFPSRDMRAQKRCPVRTMTIVRSITVNNFVVTDAAGLSQITIFVLEVLTPSVGDTRACSRASSKV